jgi:hypothetical protein
VGSEHRGLQEALADIKIRPFKSTDLIYLHEILVTQDFNDVKSITHKTLPKIGYIAMLGEHPVATGFLRRVECDVVAQIDGLSSNKHFGSVIRHEAIKEIVDMLISEAKSLKLQGVVAFTTDLTVIKRAEAIGFLKLNHNLLSLTF